MENNNIKIMGVFASVLLLVIIVTASFAYFGSFNVNLNNNVAVNVNSVSPGDATFTSNATQLNLQVPAANMSQTAADNSTAAASNTATLTVNLTGAANLFTTCTYDIVYEYDADSYVYGVSPTTKNGDKEITLQVSGVNGTNNFETEKNFDSNTISSYKNGNMYTLVSGAIIESDGTLTTQNISITGKYYNLAISQASLEGRAFTGKIYVTNHKCETNNVMFITTLMSTSTPDIYDENGLRYEGTDPNNYICLDNKTGGTCSDNSLLFRIIGLFDEDTSNGGTSSSSSKKLLKVIDTNNFGGTSGKVWDDGSLKNVKNTIKLNEQYKVSLLAGLMDGDGTNNWSSALLKTELNGTYLTTLLETSNVNSKLSIAIANAKWHLGGASSSNYKTITAAGIYTEERNTSAIYGSNPSSVYAKVGLMYPSDYGYATVGGTTTNKSSCRAKELHNWSDSSFSDCKNNDWLFTSQSSFINRGEWLLAPYSSSSNYAAYLYSSGYVNFGGYSNFVGGNFFAVRPTFYLDSSILKIVGTGDGSSSNPYRVG